MFNFKRDKKVIENIDTELGNQILDDLKKTGWKVKKEYSLFAFDKGIDFDSYTMKKASEKIYFEWCNWFEWKISGSEDVINKLSEKYNL